MEKLEHGQRILFFAALILLWHSAARTRRHPSTSCGLGPHRWTVLSVSPEHPGRNRVMTSTRGTAAPGVYHDSGRGDCNRPVDPQFSL